jgi:hypothetical protein
LTDLNPNLAVKGSRDPLGIQRIWTRFGRNVIGNLTTVSSSVRDFSTLMLGYYFAARISDERRSASPLDIFLRWEQLAAYSRAIVNEDYSFRGTELVTRRLNETSDTVVISAQPSNQILSNQKTYGLWGLYSVPARLSGILDDELPCLSASAQAFVEANYISKLSKVTGPDAHQLAHVLSLESSKLQVTGRHSNWFRAIGGVLRPELHGAEQAFFRTHLEEGGPNDSTAGRQKQFAQLLKEHAFGQNFAWSVQSVGALAKSASKNSGQEKLSQHLHEVQVIEPVLALSAMFFAYLQGSQGAKVKEVAALLRGKWGAKISHIDAKAVAELKAPIAAATDFETSERWIKIAGVLECGDYEGLVELVLQQNKSVMAGRGGAPWIEESGGKLQVRFKDEREDLYDLKDFGGIWRFPYFFESLRNVAATVRT